MSDPGALAFSVDLEPNMDGSLVGVRDAMEWYDEKIPHGTVFSTHRIATELPEIVEDLADDHEIGVHVHPREFGEDHDQLAELSPDRQAQLISTTREALADAIGTDPAAIVSFRAGRHSASEETIGVLADLGFEVDASVNVRYDGYLPRTIVRRRDPFVWNGIVEVPTTYDRLPLASRCGFRRLKEGVVTATANTLRTDGWFCSGERAIRHLSSRTNVVSMYMHPYDATTYHDGLRNNGGAFRARVERFVGSIEREFSTVGEVGDRSTA